MVQPDTKHAKARLFDILVHVTKHASSVVRHCVPPAVYVGRQRSSEDGLEISDPFRPVQNQTSLATVPS